MPNKAINSPEDFFGLFKPLLSEESKEVFLVAWLSAINRVQGFEIVSSGCLTSSLVDPRLVFRGAIIANCAAIIVGHNHPSGNPEPSSEDISITKQLIEAGKIIGITIHDHIIFSGNAFTSFAERGLL
jgi:DNA repair protein RadC